MTGHPLQMIARHLPRRARKGVTDSSQPYSTPARISSTVLFRTANASRGFPGVLFEGSLIDPSGSTPPPAGWLPGLIQDYLRNNLRISADRYQHADAWPPTQAARDLCRIYAEATRGCIIDRHAWGV